ncbi:MAG: phosphoenolpyruvate synthase, partial [Patescibacteria group bacterium]
EDLPGASFAGQQETYLNVRGPESVLVAVKKCIASLFTNRAISYRVDKGFSHFDTALSVGIQKMVRSDLASSGVAFTIDTETGFDNVVIINGSYGLGETIVQGKVTPDEFIVFKPMLGKNLRPIIGKDIGKKVIKLIYAKNGTKSVGVKKEDREKLCLSEHEVLLLAGWCAKIEKYFSEKHRRYQPMDIEWAKDGKSGKMFIVQARPETIHSTADKRIYREYRLKGSGRRIIEGIAVGTKIASGEVRVIRSATRISEFRKGEVLVTEITDPDWEPIMKIASAIITDKGGRTSHAAIVSRELGIPCVVGTKNATVSLKNKKLVTVDCSSGDVGKIYEGKVPYEILEHRLDKIPKTRTKIMVNIGSPDDAFKNHYLPVEGVGLGRLEFIIASHIKIHPNALLDYRKIKKTSGKSAALRKIIKEIESLTVGYKNKAQYYIDELAEGIAKIGAAFWPNE